MTRLARARRRWPSRRPASWCWRRCARCPPRRCRCTGALGRVLAEDVAQPGGRAALRQLGDGRLRACRPGAEGELAVVGESRAGRPARRRRSSRARPCGSRPAPWCPRAPPRWCRSSAPRSADGRVTVPASPTGRNIRRRGRGRARGRRGAARRDAAGPGGAGRAGRRRAAPTRALRAPAAGGAAGHRRRAGGAGRAARPGPDLELEPARRWPRWPPARAPRWWPCETVPGRPRSATRAALARGAGRGRRGVRLGRRVGGPARPREGRVRRRSAWRSASGAWRCGRASRPGSARRGPAAARWRSGCRATRCRRWSPSSCSRARRCGRSRAPTPTPPAPPRVLDRARGAQPAPRPGRALPPARRREDGWHAEPTGPAGLARADLDAGRRRPRADRRRARARLAAGERVEIELLEDPLGYRPARERARPAAVARPPPQSPRAREDRRRARVGLGAATAA